MCVEGTDSIDVISVAEQAGHVILTVSDHLEWPGYISHQTTLEAKLNAYLRFVESGEILQRLPNAKGRRIEVCVIFRFAPHQEGLQFLAKVR